MAGIILQGLKIKIAEPKKQRTSSGPKRQGKLVHGTVIEQKDGNFKVEVDLDGNGIKIPKILDFTPESFDLTDKLSVFTRTKDKQGRRTRIIRDKWHAKFHPGLPEQYVPFANNWIVKGYIVKNGPIELFEFRDLVGIKGYTIVDDHYEED